jgi:hypothetical protein
MCVGVLFTVLEHAHRKKSNRLVLFVHGFMYIIAFNVLAHWSHAFSAPLSLSLDLKFDHHSIGHSH